MSEQSEVQMTAERSWGQRVKDKTTEVVDKATRAAGIGLIAAGTQAPDNANLPDPSEVASRPVNPIVLEVPNPFIPRTAEVATQPPLNQVIKKAEAAGVYQVRIPLVARESTPVTSRPFFSKEYKYNCENPHIRSYPNLSIGDWHYFLARVVYPGDDIGVNLANSQTIKDTFYQRAVRGGEMGTWYYGKQAIYEPVEDLIVMDQAYDSDINLQYIEFVKKLYEKVKNRVAPGKRAGLIGLKVVGKQPNGKSWGGIYIRDSDSINVSGTIVDQGAVDLNNERDGQVTFAHEMGRMERLATNTGTSIMANGPDLDADTPKEYLPSDIAQICDSYQLVRVQSNLPQVTGG